MARKVLRGSTQSCRAPVGMSSFPEFSCRSSPHTHLHDLLLWKAADAFMMLSHLPMISLLSFTRQKI
jgi:hypothetical protein